MAYNVFGNPITDDTLKAMPKYEGKIIERKDRATEARNMKNAQDKDKNAREYVEKLKQQWGDEVSTLGLLYNATGDGIVFICDHDWHGHIGPGHYPYVIENGQWGAFLHVQTSETATGSSAAVVYCGQDNNGAFNNWMVAWSNPSSHLFSNSKVYTEIREDRHYDTSNLWGYVSNLLDSSSLNHSDTWNGCESTVIIGESTTPILEGMFSLSLSDA